MDIFTFSPNANRAQEIHWHPWERDTFRRARRINRPVLLSISAVWCHWCHVMDETTYSDDEVIEAINRHFIAVRVNRDRRPDIDGRYNMGGWPTTAFLTPAGRLITGGTYIPPERMRQIAEAVARLHTTQNQEIRNKDREFLRAETADGTGSSFPLLGQQLMEEEMDGSINQMADDLCRSIADSYDPEWSGFGHPPRYAPKFPYPELLAALCSHEEKGEMGKEDRTMLADTLDAMMEGQLHDRMRGGFFRYSTQQDWREPHYEKIAGDNAQLAEVYLRAGRVLQEPAWTAVAENILHYLIDSMQRNDGGFGGSQDADEQFYRSSREGRKRKAPQVDRTLYADVNGRIVSALLLAHRIVGDADYRELAVRALRSTEEGCSNGEEGGLLHFAPEGTERVPGLLGDYAELALAHLDAHGSTGDPGHLERGMELADAVRSKFGVERGGFSDVPRRFPDREGMLRRIRIPLHENARAALLCRKAGVIRNDPSWHQQGVATLNQTVKRAFAAGPAGGAWLSAYWEFRAPAPHARLSLPDHHDREMLYAAGQARDRHAVIDVDDGQVREPLAYVCRGSSCLPPIDNADELRKVLASTGEPADVSTPLRR